MNYGSASLLSSHTRASIFVSVCSCSVCVGVSALHQKQRRTSEHTSGCKCHVAAEWWTSRAFDVCERSEHNSRLAVTPRQTLMIQSMHSTGKTDASLTSIPKGRRCCMKVLFACLPPPPPPQKEGGACHDLSEGFIPPWSVLEALKTQLWRRWALRAH